MIEWVTNGDGDQVGRLGPRRFRISIGTFPFFNRPDDPQPRFRRGYLAVMQANCQWGNPVGWRSEPSPTSILDKETDAKIYEQLKREAEFLFVGFQGGSES